MSFFGGHLLNLICEDFQVFLLGDISSKTQSKKNLSELQKYANFISRWEIVEILTGSRNLTHVGAYFFSHHTIKLRFDVPIPNQSFSA